MNLATLKKQAQAGFTLVELLVVILIIVILSVTMLPLLKPFVTKAQYAAEGVPTIGNLRTKIELFRIEKDYLPGVPFNKQLGKPVTKAITVQGVTGGTVDMTWSDLTTPSALVRTSPSELECVQYMHPCANASASTTATLYDYTSGTVALTVNGASIAGVGILSDHVWKCIDANYAEMKGNRLRPNHFRYMTTGCAGESFLWVLGCFGAGDGLAAGCGYAVMEFCDVIHQRKFIAIFERYKPISTTQLAFKVPTDTMGTTGSDYVTPGTALCGLVPVPQLEIMMNAVNTSYAAVLEQLRLAGWAIQ